jgi:hypothetical protein
VMDVLGGYGDRESEWRGSDGTQRLWRPSR